MMDGRATSISGVRVLGRYRLQIRLTKPLGDFRQRLTLPFFCPVLPGTPVDPRGVDPAGSGPYYVAEHVVNQRVVLKRNPFYRGNRPANVDEIVWTVGQTREACLVAIEAIGSTTASRSVSRTRHTNPCTRSTASTGAAGSSS